MHTRFANTDQSPKTQNPINKTRQAAIGKMSFALCAALAAALTGCAGYVDGPRGGAVYMESPSVYVESGPAVQPEYVYYPGYQVYYSSHSHEYVYQDGRSWVSRPAPPRVSAELLFASPSVGLNFHDHPSQHHATVVRQYPRNWAPPASSERRQERLQER